MLQEKAIRKEQKAISGNHLCTHGDFIGGYDKLYLEELKKEAGDILWQLAGLCRVMGWDLEDVAQGNLDKLAARKEAGTIDGSGDGIIRGK